MNHRNNKRERGFTIIELMMAMAFISVLLVVITLTIIQIGSIYNKGLTMRAVNQSGTTISADIRQTLSGGQPFDTSTGFVLQTLNGGKTTNVGDAAGGRLCTGTYSYIWNFGGQQVSSNSYQDGSDSSSKRVGFVRVRDNGAQYCATLSKQIDDPDTSSADPREFLAADDGSLAIQSFSITQLATDAALSQALYNIVFEVGTNDTDALQREQHIDTIDTTCKPPSDAAALQNFCAVNRFDFTAQAGNRGGAS